MKSILRNISENVISKVNVSLPKLVGKIQSLDLTHTYRVYDKLTGLDRVRVAHGLVTEAEKSFVSSQTERRKRQLEVFKLEETKSKINAQLDGVSRSDESFLHFVTELHELARLHKDAKQQLAAVELAEQIAFEQFSGSLRQSQAEERVQNGRMRQWSIGFSVLAGFIGFGATWYRFRNIKSSNADSAIPIRASFPTMTKSLQDSDGINAELLKLTTRLEQQINKLEGSLPSQAPKDEGFSYRYLVWASTTAVAAYCSGGLLNAVISLFGR